jgi:dihydrolipoamide dehydrogenase
MSSPSSRTNSDENLSNDAQCDVAQSAVTGTTITGTTTTGDETNGTLTSPEVGAVDIEEELLPIDPEAIVEEAEQLLREGAPHDYDVLVIGGGPGGYVAAIRAAQLGAHVGLVEERELGGVCLNRGCIPTKSLLESVNVMRLMRRAAEYGVHFDGKFRPDFRAMHRRKQQIVEQLRGNVAHLLQEHNVDVLQGRARFVGEHSIEVTSTQEAVRTVTAVHVIIATGSLPMRLPVPGADLPGVITSDELLQQDVVPESIVVIGAGAVGVEFAYLYYELGARATLMEMAPTVLPQEDADIGREMQKVLERFGIGLLLDTKLERIEQNDGRLDIIYVQEGREERITTDMVLMATGRRANTDALGLDEAGIEHKKGCIQVDENCESSVSGVYAIGDCIRNVGWAHLASGEGTMVAEQVTGHPATIDLTHVPSCYYTHPEIASVGLTREQADAKGISTRVGLFHFRSNGKAAAAGDHDGFVKVVVDDDTEKLLGCQIIGPRATDLISEAVLALKTGQTIEEMVGAIHAHPTFSEALPEAALDARRSPPFTG